LAWEKATLAIEQARVEQALVAREKEVKAAELEQAKLAVERRKVVCPWGGQIVAVKKRAGAWVTRGEPLLRLVRMDRLRVAGHVNAAHYGPQEVSGRSASIRVTLERGRTERFTGKITFVHPEQSGNEYLVWAEVDNRMQSDQWVLRPGLHVDMAIHLAGPDAREARR
jgi:multidrug resistance efflux pump